ncbi:uncharacterized protein LOC129975270 [Argiope bruennichi]|uniref:uncharacterized protein LOC129975270 n=1 Tax=Argiope bruennichi TaxID=94029 RepID=UPI002493E11D|nr:uncharacterized protein LOC129975270 [Argiope bruennichi]
MSQFLPGQRFTLHQAVQYCGYTSFVTKFGRFTGRNLNMPNYNPWKFQYDLYTNETCHYSGYHPGSKNPQLLAPETWVIVRCIFQVAGINHEETTEMFWTCCR